MPVQDRVVLQMTDLPDRVVAALRETFDVVRYPSSPHEQARFLQLHGEQIKAVAGTGKSAVTATLLDKLPNLEIISVTSAGLDGLDVMAAEARGIKIANTSTILANEVADLALWLLVSVARNLVPADNFVRTGLWLKGSYPLGRSVAGMKVGILGLGHIGKAIASRLAIMGASIAYCGRQQQAGTTLPYFKTPIELAAWGDCLVVSCPGNVETRNLVSAAVLRALGPSGILINVARGTVVDEDALVTALSEGTISGAGLDVFAHEPDVHPGLLQSNRTTLLPHVGSATHETRARMGQAMVDALLNYFR
ncbi:MULTISPECIES: 2-hydroxyacid dehydrogenase [unclassified Chelatococcus]|uniref:2-hydroxyacid dehydrogenase n=1 Tax=unclassified Chelatococcus TaxID=2638111 RepID=UPI001BCB8223|nr:MULTISPECIES: 2-hydroxyacid dehydrogenase [unclassified Chelatococcus]MBS7700111.1 2-hydroxyacid dehydrogenase [Chelatococcus sp. YT9]MBX3556804.1 2-hydroxyacid dehydrogenase [Chelatococcus sp.]